MVNRNALPLLVFGGFLLIVLVLALLVRPWDGAPGSTPIPNPNESQFGRLFVA